MNNVVKYIYNQVGYLRPMKTKGAGNGYKTGCKTTSKSPIWSILQHTRKTLPTNLITPRTYATTTLETAGNTQRSLCLKTGWVPKRRNFIEIFMPDTIIHRVHEIAEKDGMSEGWEFLNR